MSDRPIILTILAILAILGGLILIASGALIYVMDDGEILKIMAENADAYKGMTIDDVRSAGLITLISGLLMLIVGISLFVGWSIAWYIAVVLLVISFVINVYNLVTGGGTAGILGIVIEIIIIAYLMTPKVRTHFGVSS